MVAAEFALLYIPAMPHRAGVLVIILALVGAIKFTSWYPDRVRRQSGTAAGRPAGPVLDRAGEINNRARRAKDRSVVLGAVFFPVVEFCSAAVFAVVVQVDGEA